MMPETPTKWIMWAAGLLLGFLLWTLNDKLSAMQGEHQKIFSIAVIQCYNHAENVQDWEKRRIQQERCIKKKLDPDQD